MSEKIMVALSGGVDSALAMTLLKQEGADLRAAYMKTWMNEEGIDVFGDCPWHQDIVDATACAEKIGVEFEVADMIEAYRQQIVEYLVEEYRRGRTPNPDVMCNRRMKFGKFLEFAKTRGCSKVATGHYCTLRDNPDGSRDLTMGADPGKDQSYFLCMITQEQLLRAEFPIGSLLKSEVRELARLNELPNAEKKDSQGICFLGKIRIQDFLKHYIPENCGDIVNPAGKTLGRQLHNRAAQGNRRAIKYRQKKLRRRGERLRGKQTRHRFRLPASPEFVHESRKPRIRELDKQADRNSVRNFRPRALPRRLGSGVFHSESGRRRDCRIRNAPAGNSRGADYGNSRQPRPDNRQRRSGVRLEYATLTRRYWRGGRRAC